MIKIIIQFGGKQLTLPVNPEELKISRNAQNNNLDIVGLGKATRKGEPGLDTFTIQSFFPAPNSYFYTGVSPKTCIEFINTIWAAENTNNNVAKIVTSGLPVNINMYFVIESFEYDHKAGEEEDIYYTLKIKKYVPYGVKKVETKLSGLAAARAVSPVTQVKSNPPPSPKPVARTYTVVPGDCLWAIAARFSGNGSNWRQLYDLNKAVVGNNPNLIFPNQVLTLPIGW